MHTSFVKIYFYIIIIYSITKDIKLFAYELHWNEIHCVFSIVVNHKQFTFHKPPMVDYAVFSIQLVMTKWQNQSVKVQSELLGQFRLISDRASDVSGGRICLTQNAYAEL